MTQPIIALDFASKAQVEAFLAQMPGEPLSVKVGMELFYAEGTPLIELLKKSGHEIFLDLKLHDIPNTVQRAMQVLAGLGVDLINVHAAGGKQMMEAALSGLEKGASGKRPKLIAVTQLTSTSEIDMQQEQGIQMSLLDSVLKYSRLSYEAGLDGVVCSAFEAQAIKQATTADFLCVTPGIRLEKGEADDQKRVMTPSEARQNGASQIVVGRPITQAADPAAAYQQVLKEWNRL
ncbi:orotidine-5'-phosphate decarboxylase [Listeria costaricensis]|uniref:orotidine-5'-phosphate decarboxylase n=1 Tax=Listeria costaricensis TaxID=2026604 RepID=UPI000C084890|nr:orotidine-5'-phosphate decarboxylase [Listeria costaricensis]